MAVYTEVTDDDLAAFFDQYALGEVVSCKGIAEGVENSNYLVVTTTGPFILTLYEKRVRADDLPFFLGLMEHLASRDFPCPTPVAGRDGQSLRQLCGRPAAVVTFLEGMWPRRIAPHHCAGLGHAMARMHLAAADFTLTRDNDLSLAGWQKLASACAGGADKVAPGLADTIARELDQLAGNWPDDLPTGVIHADMFPDNVFFRREALSGVIDYYFACNDLLAYDLAIGLNAWCFESDGSFNVTKARLMLREYVRQRPLSRRELDSLPLLARGSALRFLLTRLYDWLNQPEGALVTPKNPLEYLHKLRFHQQIDSVSAYGLEPALIG